MLSIRRMWQDIYDLDLTDEECEIVRAKLAERQRFIDGPTKIRRCAPRAALDAVGISRKEYGTLPFTATEAIMARFAAFETINETRGNAS